MFLCNFALYSIFTPSPVTSTTRSCFHFGSVSSFFLYLFLHSSPVAYWAPTGLGSSSFNVVSFNFSYCSWGFQSKNTEVVCHSLLQRMHKVHPPSLSFAFSRILYFIVCICLYPLIVSYYAPDMLRHSYSKQIQVGVCLL